MKNGKELILDFREKTIGMIECFENEDYDNLQRLLAERQKIINLFEENPEFYNKDEIAGELKKTDIMELDIKVSELIHQNMGDIKKKLQTINCDSLLRKKYNNDFSGNPLFFNKKVY